MDYRDVTVRLLGDVAGFTQKMGLAGDITTDFIRTVSGLEQRMDTLRIAAGKTSLALGAAMQASLTGATFAAARWEAQFSNVRKTVDATSGDLTKLERNLRQLSTTLPVSAGELANLAAIAGQLGVSTAQIDEFAVVGAKLGVATELSSEQAIVSLSRLIKVMNASEGDVEGLGAALVRLGNVSNASEGPILDFAQNIAGTAGSFGITADAVLGIATAFSEAGIESEAGGTAVQRVLIDMQTAAKTSSPQLSVFARTLGITGDQFKDLVANNPTEAFLRFNEALKAAGGDSIRILKDLNLDDARLIRAFTNVANSAGSMRDRVEEAKGAFDDPTALNEEAATRFNTLLESLKTFRNATAEVVRAFGDPFVEAVTKVIKVMTFFVNLINRIPEPIKDIIALFAGFSAGLLTTLGAGLLLAKTIGTVVTVMRLLKTTIPLTIIKGLAAGFTEVTIAGREMGFMSKGLQSQNIWMQRLFNTSREVAKGFRGMTAGIAEFLGMAATNKIKGVGLALSAAVAKPVGLLTGTTRAAEIVDQAAKTQAQINKIIGQSTGDIPTSGMERFWARAKQGYFQMEVAITDSLKRIPSLAGRLRDDANGTESVAQRIRRIFDGLTSSFRNMMARMKGNGGDAGFLDLSNFKNPFDQKSKGRRADNEDPAANEQLSLFSEVFAGKSRAAKKADDDIKASAATVAPVLGEQLDLFSQTAEAADTSATAKRRDADATSDLTDEMDGASRGMGALEIAIGAAVLAWNYYGSQQEKVAAAMGTTQTQAKQVAESLGMVYDAALRLDNIDPAKAAAGPIYETADFAKKNSEILATLASRKDDGADAQLDVVRNLIINTDLNGVITPEFLTNTENILKRIFGEEKGAEYFLKIKTEMIGPDGKTALTNPSDIGRQIAAMDTYIPTPTLVIPGKGMRGEDQERFKSIAAQIVQAFNSDEAGGAAGGQALMKSVFEGMERQIENPAARRILQRQFLGFIENASEVDGKERIDFDFDTSSYEGAIDNLREMEEVLKGVQGANVSVEELMRLSRSGQQSRENAVAALKEETGLYKILKDVKIDEARGDEAAFRSRFERALEISKQGVGLRETIKQLKQYRTNLGEAARDNPEFRMVTEQIEKMEKALRDLDLKKLDADLANMSGPEAVRRLNNEIQELSRSVDGFDQEKLEALYGKRDEALNRGVSELRSMIQEEERLLKQREQLEKDTEERRAENKERRDEALERESKSHNERMENLRKQETEALERQAEQQRKTYEDFADPFSRITNQRTESAGAVVTNVVDQNRIFAEMQNNLNTLKGMGLSSQVIEAMGLDDPKNAQQVARFVADAVGNPKVIEDLNNAWKGRVALADVFSSEGDGEAIGKIKDDFKEMRDEAEKQFREANDSIQKSYQENADEITESYNKQSQEITEQLGKIGKQTGDSIDELIKKAANSSIEAIRMMGVEVTKVMAEIATLAGTPIQVAVAEPNGAYWAVGGSGVVPGGADPYDTSWWAYLGYTSSAEASRYGETEKGARERGWRGRTNTGGGGGRASGRPTAFALGGIATSKVNALIGEAGSAEAVIPLNDRGARFFTSAMSKGMERYRMFGQGGQGGGTSMSNVTAFNGSVTVQAQDPNEMARKLKQHARMKKLTQSRNTAGFVA